MVMDWQESSYVMVMVRQETYVMVKDWHELSVVVMD